MPRGPESEKRPADVRCDDAEAVTAWSLKEAR